MRHPAGDASLSLCPQPVVVRRPPRSTPACADGASEGAHALVVVGRAGWDDAGRVGFDPVTRRRVRRVVARVRPLLLPLALVVAALVVASPRAPELPPVHAPAGPVVPEGHVLVAVQPDDPAVLAIAVPGSRVDVYAAAGLGSSDPLGEGPLGADLVVRRALVVPPPSAGGASAPLGGSGVEPAGGVRLSDGAASSAGARPTVVLLVRHEEAAALAARPGGPLLLAVRGGPARGPEPPASAVPPASPSRSP